MLIRLGYDIGFNVPAPVTIVAMLHVHPSREPDLLEPDELKLDPECADYQLYRHLRQSLLEVRGARRAYQADRFHPD